MDNFVITIARGFGSGGKEIATKLSKKLGIPCYERQLLTMASDQSGIDESLFVETDEKLRGASLTNILRKIPFTSVLEPTEKEFVSDINLYNIQAEIIMSLARSESCIIVGKCADHLLRDYKNVISIFVDAPMESCVASIQEKMYVSKERAKQLIVSTDKYRAKYYNYYTNGKKWKDSANYDMILNSVKVGRDDCVEVIYDYLKTKKFI